MDISPAFSFGKDTAVKRHHYDDRDLIRTHLEYFIVA